MSLNKQRLGENARKKKTKMKDMSLLQPVLHWKIRKKVKKKAKNNKRCALKIIHQNKATFILKSVQLPAA